MRRILLPFLALAPCLIAGAGHAGPVRAVTVAAASGSTRPAPASLTPRMVRLLDTPGRLHPLGDRVGRVPLTVRLPAGADAAAFGLLPVAPGVGAVRLLPDEVAAFAEAHPALRLSTSPPRRPQLDVSSGWNHALQFHQETGLQGDGVVVGLIDTGIDILHPDFRDASGKTRIAWMLVGGSPKGLHPDLEQAFGCTDPKQSSCAVFAAADIDAMIAANAPDAHDTEGHGTHVAGIAAGNGGISLTKYPRFVGVAPKATLVVAAPSGNGGFVDADILNGARFVFDRAAALGMPAVVNLSVGGDYGSHDGTSDLETGLSAFVGDDQPGRAIVVAAGNSGVISDPGDGTGPYGIHTEVHVAPHEEVRVPLAATSPVTNGQAFVWITFRSGDTVDVGLEGPGGTRWVGYTSPGDQGGYADGTGMDATKGGVVNDLPSANPAISKGTNSAVAIWTGHWPSGTFAVLLRGTGDASLWVSATGDAQGALFFDKAVRQGTINVPASAPALLAVGCTVNRIQWKPLTGTPITLTTLGTDTNPVPDGACYFSAAGPTPFGVQKPEISAPGGFVASSMSADADPRTNPGGLFDLGGCPTQDPHCAVMDDHHALAAGTSMSAPQVTGAIALLMELSAAQGLPQLTQARATELLQVGARRPTGHVPDPVQLGPGALDLMGARLALLDASQAPADPDPSQSWYTLSSAYARPDPTWPVWGTIELRKMDGSVAGGVDGSKLDVAVDGGDMYQSLTKVGLGTFRFAVVGRTGDTAGHIRIAITYDGVPLGTSTLPVGDDVWAALDTRVGATSGACASSAGGASGAGGVAALMAIAAAVRVARRRSRRAQPLR